MSVRDPWSLDSTSMTSPTLARRMAPISVMRGPGQAIPLASMVFAAAIVGMTDLLNESDRVTRVREERGDALHVVDERIEVVLDRSEELKGQRADVDPHVTEILRLAEGVA